MTPETPSEPTPPVSPMSEPTLESLSNVLGEAPNSPLPEFPMGESVAPPGESGPTMPEAVSAGMPAKSVAVAPSAAVAVVPASPVQRLLPGLRRGLLVAEPLSVAGVFIYLLAKSWMRWPDPMIDFPRDLYTAWRVSVGDLLYDQVRSWYGPLAHLAEATGFRIFGVGMDTVVWMNVALTAGILLLLRGIFGVIGNRFSVWLCSMTFLLVFMVSHLVGVGNYNFITPYVAQSTYAFAGLLLVLWALLWHVRSDWGWWLWLAGVGVGIAYLDKPEPLLAAGGALVVYASARLVQRFRQARPGGHWRGTIKLAWTSAAWLITGFLTTWVPVFIYFLVKVGFAYSLRATDMVPYTMLVSTYRATVAKSQMYTTFYGFDQPLKHFLEHLQAGVLLLVVCGIMVAASRAWARAEKFSFWWWLGPVVTLAAGILGAWLGFETNYWTDIGKAFNFSTVLLMAIAVGWCGWAAWRDRMDFERAVGLAVVGTAAALMLVRMILFGRVYHYGFFMALLAVLFVLHLVVGEGARAVEGQRRWNWLLPVVFAAVVLYGGLSLIQFSLRRYSLKTYEVGKGRDRFYTFQPQPAPGVKVEPGDIYTPSGLLLNLMLEEAAKALPKAKTLIAFPETSAVNYHLRVPSPIPEVEFQPTSLGFVGGPQQVVNELQANPPDGVFFYLRDFVEFGVPHFGYDEGSGQAILNWVATHYIEVWNADPHSQFYMNNPNIPLTPTGDAIDLLVPGSATSGPTLPSAAQLMQAINPQ